MRERRRFALPAAAAILVVAGAGVPTVDAAATADGQPHACLRLSQQDDVLSHHDRVLNGVAAVDHDDVWVVGQLDCDVPLLRHWDGSRWRSFAAPGLSRLYAVDGLSGSDVWVGGQGGIIHWDGSTWSASWAQSDETIVQSIVEISPDDVWAVGGYDLGFTGFKMHWDGSTWTQVGDSEPDTQLTRVDGNGSDNVWAIGSEGVIERWNGRSWKRTDDDSLDVGDIAVLSRKNVWLAGYDDASDEAAMWHWDGQDLLRVDVPTPGVYSGLSGIGAVSATDIWAVGSKFVSGRGTRPLAEHWNGRYWRLRPTPDPGYDTDVADVSPVSADEAYAVGLGKQYRFARSVLALEWDGTSWTQMP